MSVPSKGFTDTEAIHPAARPEINE